MLQKCTQTAQQIYINQNNQKATTEKLVKQVGIHREMKEQLKKSDSLTEQNINLLRLETDVKDCDDRVKVHESKITSNQKNESKLRQNLATRENKQESTRRAMQQQVDAANQEVVKKNDQIALMEKLKKNNDILKERLEVSNALIIELVKRTTQ
jgi:hypothetical protein